MGGCAYVHVCLYVQGVEDVYSHAMPCHIPTHQPHPTLKTDHLYDVKYALGGGEKQVDGNFIISRAVDDCGGERRRSTRCLGCGAFQHECRCEDGRSGEARRRLRREERRREQEERGRQEAAAAAAAAASAMVPAGAAAKPSCRSAAPSPLPSASMS